MTYPPPLDQQGQVFGELVKGERAEGHGWIVGRVPERSELF